MGKHKNLTTPTVVKDLEKQDILHIAGRVSIDRIILKRSLAIFGRLEIGYRAVLLDP